MPQLRIEDLLSQSSWLIVLYILIYIYIKKEISPNILENIYLRKHINK